MKVDHIKTIRYMGNKEKLLPHIIPEIVKHTKPGDIICDLMAGTNSIGYALKKRNKIVANDIQEYSYVVGTTLLSNFSIPTNDELHQLIDSAYSINIENKYYDFFLENYTDTYFSEHQCLDIDSIRYAAQELNTPIKEYVITLLMSVMCKVQSTPGHFAQFMPKEHTRIKPLRNRSVYDEFFIKNKDFTNFVKSDFKNSVFNMDYKELLKLDSTKSVDLFYLDSPYTNDQYSRFYHVLETVCKYDSPNLEHKAKYRDDRAKSLFCYKNSVADEFEYIIKYVSEIGKKLVISYSNKGVLEIAELERISKKYFTSVEVKYYDFKHSSQGNGTIKISEILLILS